MNDEKLEVARVSGEMVYSHNSRAIVAIAGPDAEDDSRVVVVIGGQGFSLRTREQVERFIGCLRAEADSAWPEDAGRSSS